MIVRSPRAPVIIEAASERRHATKRTNARRAQNRSTRSSRDGIACLDAGASIIHHHNDEPVLGGSADHSPTPYAAGLASHTRAPSRCHLLSDDGGRRRRHIDRAALCAHRSVGGNGSARPRSGRPRHHQHRPLRCGRRATRGVARLSEHLRRCGLHDRNVSASRPRHRASRSSNRDSCAWSPVICGRTDSRRVHS